jgi:2-dehydropantoate 2-reductase
MHILVWGASPLAGWLAARLHSEKYKVIWLADEQIASTIQRFKQLELVSPDKREIVQELRIETRASDCLKPPLDWIILATPGWGMADAVFEITRWIPPEHYPPVLALQHGSGSFEQIETVAGKERVFRGVLTRQFRWPLIKESQQVAYETIITTGSGGLSLGRHPLLKHFSPALWAAGLGPIHVKDRRDLEWSDVLWQIQANALPTLLDCPPETIYTEPRLFDIELAQLREAINVIDHLGVRLVSLPSVNVPRLATQIRWLPKRLLAPLLKLNAQLPSLRDDLERNTGRSDAAYLNGAIAVQAHNYGLPAPVNHMLAISVTDVAEGRATWEQFRGEPEHIERLIRIAARHAPR